MKKSLDGATTKQWSRFETRNFSSRQFWLVISGTARFPVLSDNWTSTASKKSDRWSSGPSLTQFWKRDLVSKPSQIKEREVRKARKELWTRTQSNPKNTMWSTRRTIALSQENNLMDKITIFFQQISRGKIFMEINRKCKQDFQEPTTMSWMLCGFCPHSRSPGQCSRAIFLKIVLSIWTPNLLTVSV